MNEYQYQQMTVIKCPECGASILVERYVAPGQSVAKTCHECGLRVILERRADERQAAQRIGPEETK